MVRIKFLLIFLIVSVTGIIHAQVNRYMVFFTNKQSTGHTVDHPETFLNPRSIQRRVTQGIDVLAEDLPVTAAYVDAIRNTGATLLYKTKWMNGALIECTSAQLASVNALSFVKSADTEFVAPGSSGARQKKSNKFLRLDGQDEFTTAQLEMLGMDQMHADGYHGEGVIIAIMDGGFSGVNTQTPFQDVFTNRINTNASWNYVANNANVYQYSEHGTGVLSVIGVQTEGTFTGGAYKASFQLYVTENVASEYRIEEYNWLFAAERADSAGVDVINTSLGYNTFDDSGMDYEKADMDGNTAVITRAAQIAASKGIFLVNSAGNSGNDPGWRIITAPADGKDILAIGNVNLQGVRSSTSSIGPAADGRTKPDVVALGTGVSVYRANGNIGSANGTSFSSPLTAGLVAGIRQRYPDMKSKDLMNAIRKSASMAANPNNELGYGIPTYQAIVNYLEKITSVEPGVNEMLSVYPNPVMDTFTIRPRNNDFQLWIASLSVVNVQGQSVDASNLVRNDAENSYSLNVSTLKPGVYFLTVQVGKTHQTYKLLKM